MSEIGTLVVVTMASLMIKVKRYAQPKYVVLGLLIIYAMLLFFGPDDDSPSGDPAAARAADGGGGGVRQPPNPFTPS
jgi:hypothetical protein